MRRKIGREPGAPEPRMRMFFRYLARRLLQAGFSVVAIIVLGFALLHLAPGDPVDVLAGEFGTASPEYLMQLRHEFGLDRPLSIQLLTYFENVLQLNLGFSQRNNMTVLDLILSRLPATLLLMTTSIALSFVAGLVLGVVGCPAGQQARRQSDLGFGAALLRHTVVLVRADGDRVVHGQARAAAGRRHVHDRGGLRLVRLHARRRAPPHSSSRKPRAVPHGGLHAT